MSQTLQAINETSPRVCLPILVTMVSRRHRGARKISGESPEDDNRLKGTTYIERCKELGLSTLEERRKIQDLSQVFKILKGVDKVDPKRRMSSYPSSMLQEMRPDQIFARRHVNQHTRQSANPWNLTKKQPETDPRLHSFGFWVVEEWNALSEDTKSLEKIGTFKFQLRREHEH
jgi:hypothetical protein